jgi:hypothetical protein
MITDQMEREMDAQLIGYDRKRFRIYLLIVLGISFVFYPLPFFLVRIPSYPEWSGVSGSNVFEYAFKVDGQNDDVVIYGDSTANHGIDPRQMSKALGLRVVNLPGSYSTLLIDKELALNHYLQSDKPPKLIIFYVSAWDLNYNHQDALLCPPYGGLETLLRHGSKAAILAFFKSYPVLAMKFPLMFYGGNLSAYLVRFNLKREQIQTTIETNGYTDMNGYIYYPSDCMIPTSLINRIAFDTGRELEARYSTPQTKVLVFAAPIPSCINAQAVTEHFRNQTLVSPPKTLPAPLFVNDKVYGHLHGVGIDLATRNLTEVVRPLLKSSSK